MSEEYIKNLEEENERLRTRIVIAEEEAERVWGILDYVKDEIKKSPSFNISTSFNEKNIDRSGQVIMINKKDLKEFMSKIEDLESFYHKIVGIIEES